MNSEYDFDGVDAAYSYCGGEEFLNEETGTFEMDYGMHIDCNVYDDTFDDYQQDDDY